MLIGDPSSSFQQKLVTLMANMRGDQDWMSKIGEDPREARAQADFDAEQEASNKHQASLNNLEEASFENEQVIELCKADVNWLAGVAMPDVFKYYFPKILLAAWALLTQTAHKVQDFSQIAMGIPRGHAKTTLVKLFILYCILFTNKKFILVICSTAQLADNLISDVADMLEESNIIRLFGD